MGVELEINKELATVSMTLTELSSIASIVNREIRGGEFHKSFNNMLADITKCYDVVTENLAAFVRLDSMSAFAEKFDDCHAAYTACYLTEISKPRAYSEDAYEEYLMLQTSKEFKTGYPLLKRTFERFGHLVDKWIDNDAWLAMCIDNMFKRLQALLNEIAAYKQKDAEDAFVIYNAALTGFNLYLTLISQQRELLKLAEAA
jgi:hypothetical protein